MPLVELRRVSFGYSATPVLQDVSLELPAGGTYYEGRGCDRCNGTGERGRHAVMEILRVTPDVRQSIHRGDGTGETRRLAIADGMRTLRQDAARHVAAGRVSIAEALSIILAD